MFFLTSKGTFELIMDESKAGHCLWITNRRGLEYWPSPSEEAKYLTHSSRFRNRSDFKAPSVKLPESFEKMCVFELYLSCTNYICLREMFIFYFYSVTEERVQCNYIFILIDLLAISSHNFIN